jgi:hypothetical protein
MLFLATLSSAFGQIKSNWPYRQELIDYMQAPSDTVYVQDRKKLERIEGFGCNDNTAWFNYLTKTGDSIYVRIVEGKFVPGKHKLYLEDTIFKYVNNKKLVDYTIERNIIDGRPAHGIFGDEPKIEMRILKIKWGRKWLMVPDSCFRDLYECHICNKLSVQPEAYLSDNRFLYMYISASDGAASYSVKFVLNRDGYITRIINNNECTDGFNFLDGMGECE